MRKGLFITFEGIDGCGKTTQLEKIAEFLTSEGFDVVKTREPGALELGAKIRKILLNSTEKISDNCEKFLFLADRAQHVDMLIRPALNEGKIVLCDRYTDSTIAYQGFGRGADIAHLNLLNDFATNSLKPDLTIVFDVELETSRERIGKNKDRMESSGKEFFEKVKEGFLEISKNNPEIVKVVDGNNSKEGVYKDTKSLIIDLMESSHINED